MVYKTIDLIYVPTIYYGLDQFKDIFNKKKICIIFLSKCNNSILSFLLFKLQLYSTTNIAEKKTSFSLN